MEIVRLMKKGDFMKSYSIWLVSVCTLVFALSIFSYKADSQMKRDEETAKEVDKINPMKPAGEATKAVIDNTVNKVLPVEIPTDSKLVQDEKACYETCKQEKDKMLKSASTEVDKGRTWAQYHRCKSDCPEKVANKNREVERGVFNEERYPAGSAIGN